MLQMSPLYVTNKPSKVDGALLMNNCFSLPAIFLNTKAWDKVKVKVKFSLEQATKAQRGSRGIALPFL
jgi:hypothetical protein